MKKRALRIDRHLGCWVLVMALDAGFLFMGYAASMVFASSAYAQEARDVSTRPAALPSPERELAMGITSPFTLGAIGDFAESDSFARHQPIMQLAEPELQNLLKVLRDADVSFANMEGPIINGTAGGIGLRKAAVIEDLKSMGIRMLNQANNHMLDGGVAGILSSSALLDEAGIVHAGAGMNLQEARAPHFLETPKGIVGLVGMISISEQEPQQRNIAATDSFGSIGSLAVPVAAVPGANGLHLKTYNVVTADQIQALRKIRDSVAARRSEVPYPDPVKGNETAESLELFGSWYKVGPKPGNFSYTMDPKDLGEILRSIRTGKMTADYMIATIHCHQNSFAFQEESLDNSVPDFLVDLAHQAIDNGADVFIAHGVHTLRGVEIYKGKPIFYGLSSFALNYQQNNKTAEGVHTPLLVTSRYDGGRLAEVRLYPVDTLRARSGHFRASWIPMTPTPEKARRTLEALQTISKPFGTTISIEGNVGVIHVPPEAQQSRR